MTQLPLQQIFDRIGSRLDLASHRAGKKNYAEKFSRELALLFASRLAQRYPGARITPHPDGKAQEFKIGGEIDAKKTDVAVWDDRAGLVVGVSIKTITARDAKTNRYTKNVVRNDMELRDEADKLHRRQPYAFLVALIFLPEDSSWDSRNAAGGSSFAHAVFTFRKRTGRTGPDAARFDLFEQVYIGLFGDDGSVGFFDVEDAPRRNQPPAEMLDIEALVERISIGARQRHVGHLDDRFAENDPCWKRPTGEVTLLIASADELDEEPEDEQAGSLPPS